MVHYSTASHQCGPCLDSRTWCNMWVEFVVGSRPCSESFSIGTPVSLSPQKPTFRNSNLIWRKIIVFLRSVFSFVESHLLVILVSKVSLGHSLVHVIIMCMGITALNKRNSIERVL